MTRTTNVGILGYGFIGKVHAYAYRCLPFVCDPVPLAARITHVCTGHTETAEKAAADLGAEHAVTDYRRVTEDPDVDIVHVCTPNHLHAEALLSAMAHGKHIYCDKPLVATEAEADAVAAALADYAGTAQMTFHNRFFPATLKAAELADAGFLGEPLEFRAVYLHGGNVDPQRPLKWKLSGAAGGGVIPDLGSHVLDLVHRLLGPYERVLAQTKIAYRERPDPDDPSRTVAVDAEDAVQMLVRMQCGAVGTVEATKVATGTEDELRFEIHGTGGAMRFRLMEPHYLEAYDAVTGGPGGTRGWTRLATGRRYGPPDTPFPSPKAAIGWTRAHVACLVNFLSAVADGRPAQPDLGQGVTIQRLMARIRDSAERDAWVDV
jgi:predicted dehydrogenase